MEPTPDARWANFTGGIAPGGRIRPMSFGVLHDLTVEWEQIVPSQPGAGGATILLRTARSLFAHAWFDYEFMAVACLVGFQATEAGFRELYPDMGRKPYQALVDRARGDGILPERIADVADAGVKLRNLLSHPLTQSGFTLGMAAGMLENQHRLVAVVMAAAAAAA